MTTKQIAESTGRKIRAVHEWVSATSANNAQVLAKVSEAKVTQVAADYTLDEVLEIISTGLRSEVSQQYAQGAALTKAMTSPVVRDDLTMDWLEPAIQNLIETARDLNRENHEIIKNFTDQMSQQERWSTWIKPVDYETGLKIIDDMLRLSGVINTDIGLLLQRLDLPLDTWEWALRQCHMGALLYSPPRFWAEADLQRVWRFWHNWKCGRLPMIHGPR